MLACELRKLLALDEHVHCACLNTKTICIEEPLIIIEAGIEPDLICHALSLS